MRILHTSDWHLGKTLEQISRIEEQREFIDELCRIVEQEKIDMVLVAGDIFDTYTPSSAAEELFYQAVDRLNDKGRRAVVIIAGNHDSPERLCAASPLAYKNGIILLGYPASDAGDHIVKSDSIKIINSGKGWLELSIAGCEHNAVIITLPYPSESRLEQVLSKEADEEKLQKEYSARISDLLAGLAENFREDTVNLIVSHLFIMGGKESDSERPLQVGGALTVAPSAMPSAAHFVALGHLHRPQRVKNAPAPTYYSGSPLAYSFSEAGYSKLVYVIEAVPGKEADVKEVFLRSGKPLKKWTAKNGMEEALKWCEEGKDKGSWIDLEVYTDRPLTLEEQKKLREMNPGIINIRPKVTTEAGEDISCENRENKRIDELFKDYYKYRTSMEISEELMGAFLDVLNEEREEESKVGGDEVEAKIS